MLTSIEGKPVWTKQNANETSICIPTAALSKGAYILTVISDSKTIQQLVVKE